MIKSNNLIYAVSAGLFFFLSLPLFILGHTEQSLIVFSLVSLYLFITFQLDVLIRIAKSLKWTKTAVILVGFFGIKNVFFAFYFVFLFLAKMITSEWSILLLPGIYFIYSFLIGKKLLTLNEKDFESVTSE
ncbi:MAG: hypothetical protein ACI9O4_000698 [Chitinophagales bacterium]